MNCRHQVPFLVLFAIISIPYTSRAAGAAPELLQAASLENGQGMRLLCRKHWRDGIDQYVGVVSLPDEATLYCTAFRAGRTATVTVKHPFRLRADSILAFEKPVVQYRGTRWLNMSDHLGFVSVDPLPASIPAANFILDEDRTYELSDEDWFGRGAVVVYARQAHEETEALAGSVQLLTDTLPGRIGVSFSTSRGPQQLDVDFRPFAP